MSQHTLTAGVGRVDITPPLGFRMQGAMRRIEGAVGVESRLLATALVLADENTKTVILDCDLIGFDRPLAERIRQAVGDRVGVPAGNVLVGCTHTHNGPCTARGILAGPHDVAPRPGEVEALDVYIENLIRQLAGVAGLADSTRQPARVGAARDQADVAVNREEIGEDGVVLVGRNPAGISDRSVDVLRVDDLAGKPIAAIVGYAAHPVVMGYQVYVYSQDYPGVVRRMVEQATGATCLFLTGAAGNQACWSFLQPDWGEQERMGGRIGGAALNAFYQIETRPYSDVRERGKSLSLIALYHKEFHAGPTHQVFRVANGLARVKLQPLPSLAQAEAEYQKEQGELDRLFAENAPTTLTAPQGLVARWATSVLAKVRAGQTEAWLDYPLMGIRIDDFALLAMPGEPFVEIGLGAKRRSMAAHTMFSGYANGVQAYLPTAQTVKQGGMSVSSAVRTYNIPAPPTEDAVDTVVAAFGGVLDELGL